MSSSRSFLVCALFLIALIFSGARRARAQEPPPDLKMLLNLDLFASHPQEKKSAQSSATGQPQARDSMLEQIRALNALGYLGSNSGPPGDSVTENAHGPDIPRSQPSNGAEVQP